MKNIILAGTSIVIVSLLGASVFASTITTNTSPQLSGLTTWIISVLWTNMIANPAITMLSSSDLYIEEKIRPHIGKSKNMNIIAASWIISLSGQSSMSGTWEIMVNSGSLLNSTINLGNRYANRSEKIWENDWNRKAKIYRKHHYCSSKEFNISRYANSNSINYCIMNK